jgi:hypothetical protein
MTETLQAITYTILIFSGFYMAIRAHGRSIKETSKYGNYYDHQKGKKR